MLRERGQNQRSNRKKDIEVCFLCMCMSLCVWGVECVLDLPLHRSPPVTWHTEAIGVLVECQRVTGGCLPTMTDGSGVTREASISSNATSDQRTPTHTHTHTHTHSPLRVLRYLFVFRFYSNCKPILPTHPSTLSFLSIYYKTDGQSFEYVCQKEVIFLHLHNSF